MDAQQEQKARISSGGGLDLDEFDPNSLFFYRTAKRVKIKVWQLGLAYHAFSAALLIYVVYTIFTSAQWAALDDVSFSFNGWVSAGTSSTVSSDDVSYCTNSSYDYDYGGGWTYKLPTCVTHSPAEISVKEPDRIFITTMYQQTTSIGWACDDPEHASNVAACAGVFTAVGLQCQCETLETIFPLATEEMTISLRHAYATLGPSPAGRKSGDSSIAAEDADGNVPLDTVFAAADRDAAGAAPSDVVIKGGAAGGISFTLAQWLGMAGVHLDRANTAEPTDARPGVERKPFYRMTGVQLDVEIDYSNKNLETGKADPTVSRVTAEVVLSPKRGWAGLGALPTVFAVYPSNYTFHTVDRYRQGVVINFKGRGTYYRFDYSVVMTALITGAVLISSAGILTDVLAINLYRVRRGGRFGLTLELTATSRVLRAKRTEDVSPDAVLAAQGMIGALAVSSFESLDSDGDGLVDAGDIVRAFARVPGIEYTQAAELARLIVDRGDRSGGNQRGDGKLSFAEFVSVLAQDMMPFHHLLACMSTRARLELGASTTRSVEVPVSEAMFDVIRQQAQTDSTNRPPPTQASVVGC